MVLPMMSSAVTDSEVITSALWGAPGSEDNRAQHKGNPSLYKFANTHHHISVLEIVWFKEAKRCQTQSSPTLIVRFLAVSVEVFL